MIQLHHFIEFQQIFYHNVILISAKFYPYLSFILFLRIKVKLQSNIYSIIIKITWIFNDPNSSKLLISILINDIFLLHSFPPRSYLIKLGISKIVA